MKKVKALLIRLGLFMGLLLTPTTVRAQSAKLHHLQSGALLSFCNAETILLYTALSAREFDMSFTKGLISSLAWGLKETKKNVDRSIVLLNEKEAKLEVRFEKLRGLLVSAERQTESLGSAMKDQVIPYMEAMDSVEEGEETPPVPNWKELKRHVGWIAYDLGQAERIHRSLGKKLKTPKLRSPKKPRGKRS